MRHNFCYLVLALSLAATPAGASGQPDAPVPSVVAQQIAPDLHDALRPELIDTAVEPAASPVATDQGSSSQGRRVLGILLIAVVGFLVGYLVVGGL